MRAQISPTSPYARPAARVVQQRRSRGGRRGGATVRSAMSHSRCSSCWATSSATGPDASSPRWPTSRASCAVLSVAGDCPAASVSSSAESYGSRPTKRSSAPAAACARPEGSGQGQGKGETYTTLFPATLPPQVCVRVQGWVSSARRRVPARAGRSVVLAGSGVVTLRPTRGRSWPRRPRAGASPRAP
jgi:hypothetical protein